MAVISSIVEGLERRGRHNVNRVAVSCVVFLKALKDASHADRLPDVAEADTLARMYAAYLESPRR